VPEQWTYRPGVLKPETLSFEERRPGRALDDRVFYRLSNWRWVAAGTYMATTTRLTTMEAANESGRHAVNAILNRLLVRQGADYNAQGRMFADWAETWNPEKYELDDLEPLKRLDEKLAAEGLPHVLDILKVVETIDALPMHGNASDNPIAKVVHLFQHAASASGHDWGFLKDALNTLLVQGAERMPKGLDPLGVLSAGKDIPADLLDRIKQAIGAWLSAPGDRPAD
jgi:hypothetical protein